MPGYVLDAATVPLVPISSGLHRPSNQRPHIYSRLAALGELDLVRHSEPKYPYFDLRKLRNGRFVAVDCVSEKLEEPLGEVEGKEYNERHWIEVIPRCGFLTEFNRELKEAMQGDQTLDPIQVYEKVMYRFGYLRIPVPGPESSRTEELRSDDYRYVCCHSLTTQGIKVVRAHEAPSRASEPETERAVKPWSAPTGYVGVKTICTHVRFQKSGKNPPRTTIQAWEKSNPTVRDASPDSRETFLPESWVFERIAEWNPRSASGT